MIGARTCDKSRDDLSLARETDPNMSDEISRSIASAVSQAVQRAVDEASSRLPISLFVAAQQTTGLQRYSLYTKKQYDSTDVRSESEQKCVARGFLFLFFFWLDAEL